MNDRLVRWLAASASIVFVAACSTTPNPSTPSASPGEPAATQLQGNGQGPDVNPNAPPVGGECQFKVGAQCFADADAACKAAGCERSSCQLLETFPAQVRCTK